MAHTRITQIVSAALAIALFVAGSATLVTDVADAAPDPDRTTARLEAQAEREAAREAARSERKAAAIARLLAKVEPASPLAVTIIEGDVRENAFRKLLSAFDDQGLTLAVGGVGHESVYDVPMKDYGDDFALEIEWSVTLETASIAEWRLSILNVETLNYEVLLISEPQTPGPFIGGIATTEALSPYVNADGRLQLAVFAEAENAGNLIVDAMTATPIAR